MSQQAPRVCVSVINWNGAAMTIACLRSLSSLTYRHFDIIVVDNASIDDSAQRIQAAFPDVFMLCSKENLGFAGGHRLALEKAQQDDFELFWMLNNDAQVRPDTLTALVEAYRHQGAALYGSVILQADDPRLLAFGGGWHLDPDGTPRAIGHYNPRRNQPYDDWFAEGQEQAVAALHGASMMVPLEVVQHHGFMDEDFFLNAEETDYCFRLGKKGIPSILVPTSIVTHIAGGSVRLAPRLDVITPYYQTRNRLVFVRRHEGLWAYLKLLFARLKETWRIQLLSLLRPERMRIHSRRSYYQALGIRHAVLNRMGKTVAPEDFLDNLET